MKADSASPDRKYLIQRGTEVSSTQGGGSVRMFSGQYTGGVGLAANSQNQPQAMMKAGTIIPKRSQGMNVCQWVSFGILLLTLMFLFSFIVYQFSTWNKVRVNRYG